MGIRGKGTDANAGLSNQLRLLRDQRRQLTADTQVDAGEDARKALVAANAKRVLLDELKDTTGLSGPAEAALPGLQQDRLAIEDATLLKYAQTLGLFTPGAEVKLTPEQTAAMLALMNDRWSAVERWLVDVALPSVPEEMRADISKRLEAERAADKARGKGGSLESLSTKALAFATSAGPGVASTLLYMTGAIAGPIGLGVSLGMASLGGVLGQQLHKKLALRAVEFGANAFDGVSLGGPYERLARRAKEAALSPANVHAWLKREANLSKELMKIAEGEGKDAEQVKKYVARLQALQQGAQRMHPDALLREVTKARDELLANVSFDFKFETKHLPKVSNEYLRSLVEAHDRFTLAIENPVASSLLETLLQRHGVDTDTFKHGTKLGAAELSTLKKAVGPEPSIAEYGALRVLERNGMIDLEEVWGKDFRKKLPDTVVEEGELKNVADAGASERAFASRLYTGSKIGFVAVPLLLALSGVGVPLALAAGFGGSIAGAVIGKRLQSKGEMEQVLAGVDQIHRSGNTEYAFALEIARNPLPKKDSEVKDAIKQHAAEIKLLAESALVQSVMPRRGAPAQGELFAQIEEFAELRGHIYQQLLAYSTALDKIAAQRLSPAEMRKEVAHAQKALLDDGFVQNVFLDGLKSDAVPDMPPKLGAFVTAFVQFQREMETDPKDAAVEARGLLASLKDLPKDQRTEFAKLPLIALARAIADGNRGENALSQDVIGKIVAGRKQSFDALQALWNKFAPISDKRAVEVANEMLGYLWTQYLPRIGIDVDGDPPKLENAKVTKKMDADGLPLFEVKAHLDDGGKITIPITAFGIPVADLAEFRLSEQRLAQIAQGAVARHLSIASPGATIQSTTRVAQADATREAFEVKTSAGKFRIELMQEGVPLLSTLAQV